MNALKNSGPGCLVIAAFIGPGTILGGIVVLTVTGLECFSC